MNPGTTAGAILCGGKSSRLGDDKAFAALGHQSLVEHVIGRLRPQVDELFLSVQQESGRLAGLGLPLLSDAVQRHRGPLTGLYTALKHAKESQFEWLALCPCDAPFVPGNLVRVMHESVDATGVPLVSVNYGGVMQPTFSLWHRDLLEAVETIVLEQGKGGLMFMFDRLDHAVIDWPDSSPPPFFNINTVEDLDQARALLDAESADG